jgi:hypothetical protein
VFGINELITQRQQLPQTLDGLAKFVLIGREKLTAVKAEIRAIEKLELAQEVRDQKREEAQWLSDALLDAEVKIGDLLREIPKSPGGRPSEKTMDTGVHSLKPKAEIIEGLGFSVKQAQRYETLSENKDLVEQVKQEARENDDLPTRSRVLDLARERSRRAPDGEREYYDYLDECGTIARQYNNAIGKVCVLKADSEDFKKWKELMFDEIRESALGQTNRAIETLIKIKEFLRRPLK